MQDSTCYGPLSHSQYSHFSGPEDQTQEKTLRLAFDHLKTSTCPINYLSIKHLTYTLVSNFCIPGTEDTIVKRKILFSYEKEKLLPKRLVFLVGERRDRKINTFCLQKVLRGHERIFNKSSRVETRVGKPRRTSLKR